MELPSLNLPYTCNASESILQFEPLNLQISPNKKKMAVLSATLRNDATATFKPCRIVCISLPKHLHCYGIAILL